MLLMCSLLEVTFHNKSEWRYFIHIWQMRKPRLSRPFSWFSSEKAMLWNEEAQLRLLPSYTTGRVGCAFLSSVAKISSLQGHRFCLLCLLQWDIASSTEETLRQWGMIEWMNHKLCFFSRKALCSGNYCCCFPPVFSSNNSQPYYGKA